MNSILGSIEKIDSSKNMSLITVKIDNLLYLKSIILKNTHLHFEIGKKVRVLFKETEVVVGLRGVYPISLQNKIDGVVRNIEKMSLLSKIEVDTQVGVLVSVISTQATEDLHLDKNVEVTLMIKLNEIMIAV